MKMTIYDDFDNISIEENKISKMKLLDVLKKYSSTVSVFDLMKITSEMLEDTKYVQKEYRKKSHEVYGRLEKYIEDNRNRNEIWNHCCRFNSRKWRN